MPKNFRWLKMKKREALVTENFLRKAEEYYVSACSRFIDRETAKNNIWVLYGKNGELSALLLHSRKALLPALCGRMEIPVPDFLCGLFRTTYIHSVQGLKEEAILLEKKLEELGRKTSENIDYDLMAIDKAPDTGSYSAGPKNLVLRKPLFTDIDSLAALQANYEREEVLPKGSVFYPAASRRNTEMLVKKSEILAAELNGRIVGKINVNAVSFTRFQVGGVYVHPDFRGQGIASRMAVQFIDSLVARDRGVSLFVKKSNLAARKLYERLGFAVKGDYRISYYS